MQQLENPQKFIDDIIKALGKTLPVKKKEEFATGLAKELQDVFRAKDVAFPSAATVRELEEDLSKLDDALNVASRLVKRIEKKAEKEGYIQSLLRLCSRVIKPRGYSADISDVMALIELARRSTNETRHRNEKMGPDTRLANEVCLIVARRYKNAFGKTPGMAGEGNRDDGTPNKTPYQRVCEIVAKRMKIKGIGKTTQANALDLLRSGAKSPWPFFKPNVDFLPQKKT